eukprot:SAG11_NODE_18620_length_485_cov_2.378238_1_plen_91_part_10
MRIVLACFVGFWFWGLINDARERIGKRRRGIAEKVAANIFVSKKMQEQLQQVASGRRLKCETPPPPPPPPKTPLNFWGLFFPPPPPPPGRG